MKKEREVIKKKHSKDKMCLLKKKKKLSRRKGGLSHWLSGKESACSAGAMDLIPGWGRSPGGGHGNPLRYSCLETPKDRGAWWAAVHGVAKSQE